MFIVILRFMELIETVSFAVFVRFSGVLVFLNLFSHC